MKNNYKTIKKHLKNGIMVTGVKKIGAPLYLEIVIRGGNGFIADTNKKGLPHLIEHLFVSGSPRFPTKDLLTEYFDSFGITVGGYTDRDVVVIHTTAPDISDLDFVLAEISENIKSPDFQITRLEHEKEIVQSEIKRAYSKIDTALYKIYYQNVFSNTSYQDDPLGSSENVSRFSQDNVRWWNNSFINSGAISCFASGDFKMEILVKILEKYFGSLTKNKLPITSNTVTPKYIPIAYSDMKSDHVYITYGYAFSNIDQKQLAALYIINSILGKPRSGILSKIFREKEKMVYNIPSQTWLGFLYSEYHVSTSVSSENLDSFLIKLKELFNSLESIISKQLFMLEKNRIKKVRVLSLEKSTNIVIAMRAATESYSSNLEEMWNIIDSTTYEDVLSMLKIMKNSNWVLARTK